MLEVACSGPGVSRTRYSTTTPLQPKNCDGLLKEPEVTKLLPVLCKQHKTTSKINKKLSCRRGAARRSGSLKILLSLEVEYGITTAVCPFCYNYNFYRFSVNKDEYIRNVLTKYNSQRLGGLAFSPRSTAVFASCYAWQSPHVVRRHLVDAHSRVTQVTGRCVA